MRLIFEVFNFVKQALYDLTRIFLDTQFIFNVYEITLVIRMAVSEFEYESCIHSYYVYKDKWSSTVGEHLICEREMLNSAHRYAVTVLKDDVIIGAVMSRIVSDLSRL